MSRRVYLLGVGLALLALAFAVTDWALSLQPGVTAANAKRIRVGMAEQEVESLLGRPADRYYHPWDVMPFLKRAPGSEPEWEQCWSGDEGYIFIQSDAPGAVLVWGFLPSEQPRPSPLARLRAWLGW
jgi:hypothetical protein